MVTSGHCSTCSGDLGGLRFAPSQIRGLLKEVGLRAMTKSPPIPPEEVKLGSRFTAHTKRQDKKSITHHYEVSNDFYRMVLGPSWTYSCAVFENQTDSLEQAQANKYELICRKLGLEPGMRLLDVGCGWGGMLLHAAKHYDVEAVGITISEAQASLARERVKEAGLEDQIEIRLQDYRDLSDGPFDAISSIGMFEHVGLAHLTDYFEILRGLLAPSGRLLNHQIGRTPMPPIGRIIKREQVAVARDGFIHRYVFPDGELHEVGDVVGQMQRIGLEARHMESIREHYALTLRHWVSNLEANWDQAVAEVGEGRARVWRLYMAATSVNFKVGQIQVHQILGVKLPKAGAAMGQSLTPLRHRWEYDLSVAGGGDRADSERSPRQRQPRTVAGGQGFVRPAATVGGHRKLTAAVRPLGGLAAELLLVLKRPQQHRHQDDEEDQHRSRIVYHVLRVDLTDADHQDGDADNAGRAIERADPGQGLRAEPLIEVPAGDTDGQHHVEDRRVHHPGQHEVEVHERSDGQRRHRFSVEDKADADQCLQGHNQNREGNREPKRHTVEKKGRSPGSTGPPGPQRNPSGPDRSTTAVGVRARRRLGATLRPGTAEGSGPMPEARSARPRGDQHHRIAPRGI